MLLEHGPHRAVVDLDGGRLASLCVDGVELLVTSGPKATRWGSFPMVPWCGRLRNGELEFDGHTHHFPLTSPPHANHGFCHTQAWTETGPGTLRTELGAPWPFGGHVVQRFGLADDHLSVTIEVHAAHEGEAMPAMAGWHPWFRRDLGVGGPVEVVVAGGRAYAVGDDGIPTGDLVEPPPQPWDLCLTELDADPVLRWPGALEVTVSSSFDHWVVFTEPEHAVCVEPQGGAPNDIARVPHLVEPGRPLVGTMTIAWRRSAE